MEMDNIHTIKMHPTLDILCDTFGRVFVPGKNNSAYKWTYGCVSDKGYRIVRIDKKNYRVHRLIAETFLPIPKDKPFVDHINRDRSCNELSNLRFVTAKENARNSSVWLRLDTTGCPHTENIKAYKDWRKNRGLH